MHSLPSLQILILVSHYSLRNKGFFVFSSTFRETCLPSSSADMGKKRKREKEQEEPTAVEAEPTGPDAETQGDPAADGPGGEQHNAGAGDEQEGGYYNSGRRRKSLVNPETASYLEEVVAHFKTLVDDEERCLLVGNVLEEVSGHEVKVAGDPVCSRHIETLMGAASAPQLLAFLTAVSDVDGFFSVVSGWGGVGGS